MIRKFNFMISQLKKMVTDKETDLMLKHIIEFVAINKFRLKV